MIPTTQPIVPSTKTLAKNISDDNFFLCVNLQNLSQEEKDKRLDAIRRVAILHFINNDLPSLLSPDELIALDAITQSPDLDLSKIQTILREKVSCYDDCITSHEYKVKKELIHHHYKNILLQMELRERTMHEDVLLFLVTIKRLLNEIEREKWDVVFMMVKTISFT